MKAASSTLVLSDDGWPALRAFRAAGLPHTPCRDWACTIEALSPITDCLVVGADVPGAERLPAALATHPAGFDLAVLWLAGRPPPALRGLNVAAVPDDMAGSTLAALAAACVRAGQGRRAQRIEDRLRARADDLARLVAERTAELNEANRRLLAEAAERERAEEKLRQAQKMEAVGRLTGGIAHDFNNLLSAIMGNLELLRGRLADERAIRLASNALTAVERGAKLTGQLLAFSRMQRLPLTALDATALLDGLRPALERALGPRVALRIDAAPDAGRMMTDPQQFELALLNLASNARDAMPEGGILTVSVTPDNGSHAWSGRPGQYLAITVADTGTGMPPDVRERAFEPFYTTKTVGAGSGLGLSQVYGIAKQSGGVAMIDSAPGIGTTVTLLLPRAPDPETALPDAPSSGSDRGGDRRGSVLVIDDDPDVRRFIVESLDALGYGVTEASHGEAGLEALSRSTPDVMIVDFAMPGMNGAMVANEALRRHPHLPIVFATGYADTEELGGELLRTLPLLRKPFRINELASTVAGVLAARGLAQERV